MLNNKINVFSILILLIILAIDYTKTIPFENFTTIYYATDDSTFEFRRTTLARYNIHNAIEQINLDPNLEVRFVDVTYSENRPEGYWLLVGPEVPDLKRFLNPGRVIVLGKSVYEPN